MSSDTVGVRIGGDAISRGVLLRPRQSRKARQAILIGTTLVARGLLPS